MSSDLTYIYIIGKKTGPLKIGFASNVKSRLSNLQTASSEELQVLYSQATTKNKARIIEKLVHRQIAHKRIRGEWFNIPLDDAIDEVKYAFIRWESEDNLELLYKLKKL